VDALIVAGDLFDTGTPPSYAREMFNRFVVALQPRHARLALTGGEQQHIAVGLRRGDHPGIQAGEQFACLRSRAGQSGRDKQTSLLEAIAHHYQQRVAAARALDRR
jgi:exonuclease SbcD